MVEPINQQPVTHPEPGNRVFIAPSLLASNYGRLTQEVRRVNRSGAEWLHLDIMDGHFVPNLSFGPGTVRTIRPETKLLLDVHLMCDRPEALLDAFAKAGADQITVHIELGDRAEALLWKIRALGKKAGLAINPPTSMSHLERYLDRVDCLLVMTVNPGFGGQAFIGETLPKIQQAAAWRRQRGLHYRLEVDGGIDFHTAPECARAGADTFVSGSTLFSQPNLKAGVARLRRSTGLPPNTSHRT